MFFNFFRRNANPPLQWKLKPLKFPKKDLRNYGGKCILPQIILAELFEMEIPTPYTFEISHCGGVFKTNCGVLDFTAEDLTITVPEWMYQQLDLAGTDKITLKIVVLPKGRYVKLLPHSHEFLDIENPKRELEKTLRNYQVLTQGDEILCNFEEGNMRFTVAEVKPAGLGVYIVDTDLEVEFLPPFGYEEKLEREKTVTKYLNVLKSDLHPRRISMKKPGLFFDFKKFSK
ncbi:hypothetical protein EDEG_00463 [Edhazardia aedis USNM 41457]|uniref:Ubiquitin fusion degradation protein UFD1 n=1 Tax=Edhazardia aedis (strain USNM 41457) TaxID=1003232 RepID=J9DFJ8_EDHAE|nr:hypothetical protein EDEG_00463 [Edhazardia aedis USNM 41457]|eukprot:EJW01375.1 hypothetical protein EDEG_00463 [Edhazardia aedis USNM 41457]